MGIWCIYIYIYIYTHRHITTVRCMMEDVCREMYVGCMGGGIRGYKSGGGVLGYGLGVGNHGYRLVGISISEERLLTTRALLM